MDNNELCEHTRIRLIAAAIGHQQCTKTAANLIPLPGTDRFIAIGTAAEVARLLEISPAAPIQATSWATELPDNEALEELWQSHVGHPADFGADVLERWGGWQPGLLGYGGSLNTAPVHDAAAPSAEQAPADMQAHFLAVQDQCEHYRKTCDELRAQILAAAAQAGTKGAALDERALFEEWARDHLGQGYSLAMYEHTYEDKVTRWAFKAWQARAAIAQSTASAPVQQAAPEAPASDLISAADAVVERWHSRDWKQPHTRDFIDRLASAVGEAKARRAPAPSRDAGQEEASTQTAPDGAAGTVEKDAARYRFMRNVSSWGSDVYGAISEGTREDIDAAIDSAIEAHNKAGSPQ